MGTISESPQTSPNSSHLQSRPFDTSAKHRSTTPPRPPLSRSTISESPPTSSESDSSWPSPTLSPPPTRPSRLSPQPSFTVDTLCSPRPGPSNLTTNSTLSPQAGPSGFVANSTPSLA